MGRHRATLAKKISEAVIRCKVPQMRRSSGTRATKKNHFCANRSGDTTTETKERGTIGLVDHAPLRFLFPNSAHLHFCERIGGAVFRNSSLQSTIDGSNTFVMRRPEARRLDPVQRSSQQATGTTIFSMICGARRGTQGTTGRSCDVWRDEVRAMCVRLATMDEKREKFVENLEIGASRSASNW